MEKEVTGEDAALCRLSGRGSSSLISKLCLTHGSENTSVFLPVFSPVPQRRDNNSVQSLVQFTSGETTTLCSL